MTDSTRSMLQQQLSSEGNLLVIDGDAIAFMIGWHHREHQDISTVHKAVDTWFKEFLTLASADAYIGVLASGEKCFRYDVYKYKPYKGNRPAKEDWIAFWEPIIRQRLIDKHGFVPAPSHLETDDVVATLGILLPHNLKSIGIDKFPYICSPDKDLKQIPGYHIDYRKVGEEGGGLKNEFVSTKQATYNWCMQMLTGDTADNIAGVPGQGEKKAQTMLDSVGELRWKTSVKLAYLKYFSDYYGEIIYQQTADVITMVTPMSLHWHKYGFDVDSYLSKVTKATRHAEPFYS